jgi:outer membrane protein insertion porin family
MSLARQLALVLTAMLLAAVAGCAAFDHSPQALSRSIANSGPVPRSQTAQTLAANPARNWEESDEFPITVTKPPILRAQSPDGPTPEDYPRRPMLPSGTEEVAQQPLYSPPPGAYTPITPPGGVPQTTIQPPPGGAYGGGGYTFQPNAGAPAGQPYSIPDAGGGIPGFPDAAPSILGDRPPPPPNMTPLDIYVNETRTGKFMFGVGVNSDAGVSGQITIDERNFDIWNPPTSWDDFLNGTAWRGRGQGFRLEAQPGNQFQRYLVSFTEPYLFDTPITMALSGFYFQRNYFDWFEERVGGRMAYGYRLTPNLSLTGAVRAEDVQISHPRVAGVPELDAVLGSTDFYSGRLSLTHDTRDNSFIASQGHYLELGLEQGFGEFSFPRADVDFRQYFNVRSRPDGTGRHIVALSSRAGFSGSDTPLFERYYAGGYSSLRGFAFRGASPVDSGVRVGGNFQWLNSVEYFFPLTADDMVRGTVFCDYGTVENTVTIKDFRVAPGFGVLLNIPALGPAPLAINFAFPIASADTDKEQVFSFFFGASR